MLRKIIEWIKYQNSKHITVKVRNNKNYFCHQITRTVDGQLNPM